MVAWERQEPVKSNKSNQSHNESSPLAERQPSLPGKKKTEFGTFWNYFMATWPGCQQVNRILAAFGCGSHAIPGLRSWHLDRQSVAESRDTWH